MQRLIKTHIGVTDHGLNAVQLAINSKYQSIDKLGNALSEWAAKTANQLNDRLDKAESTATELENKLQKQGERIDQDILPRLVKLEAQGPGGEWANFIPKQVTPQAMQCIRVLAQAQDLVTDKDFVLKTNNETLKKMQGSEPYKECVEKITDACLKAKFISAFASFGKGDMHELSQRLLLIQRLNIDLIRIFEPRTA